MESDAALVAEILDGERARFSELVRRHERAVRATAFAVLLNHHSASDVAQEAFLQAFQQLNKLRDAAAFGGWVRTIAHHRALTVARRPVKTDSLDCIGDVATKPDTTPDEEQASRLIEAVRKLPEHEQTVVMLYYFDGHDTRAISEITIRPIGTVTMQLSRARERLRAWMKELEP